MPGLPSSGQISMIDINSELDLLTPATNIDLKADLYNTANTGGGTGLMYHNLNMASGNATSAKVAIYDPLNANANMSMSNWYNYLRDCGMVMTYLITNNSSYDVFIDLVIWDQNNTSQGTIYNNPKVDANSNTGTQTVNTGLLAITGGGGISSGYRVAVQNVTFQPGPGPGQTFSVALGTPSASDTDGVGAGTTRTTYALGSYTEDGPTFPPTPPSPPYTATKAVDASGSLIPVNKRTTITITIT